LGEVNELFTGWEEHPPVYVLVKAIVQGLGGGGAMPSHETIEEQTTDDQILSKLRAEVQGLSMPIVRGRDPGLPKSKVVTDLDQMREKNRARIIERNQPKHA
jgi:hypothetical protein